MDALVVEELPEIEDGGLLALEKALEALGVALVRYPFVRVPLGRILQALVEQIPSASSRGCGVNSSTSTPGTALARTSRRRPRALPGCGRSLRRRPLPARARRARPPAARYARGSSTRARAVCLDREPRARGCPDRAARKHVVAEDEVGRQALADRGCVRRHEVVEFRLRQILKQSRLEASYASSTNTGSCRPGSRVVRPPRLPGRSARARAPGRRP